MFTQQNILYEDNHIMVVNKPACQLVQSDTSGDLSLEDEVKEFIKRRNSKPGSVFLGVIHRIDRPVSGIVILAKTSKALSRMCEMIKNRTVKKTYWAITENKPSLQTATLKHYIERNSQKNRSYAYDVPRKEAKEAVLTYDFIASSDRYYLLEVDLITGRHHQIRCQLSKMGLNIKGDLKYGASRSNSDGSISLHARCVEFEHPVTKNTIKVTAPILSNDNLWQFFETNLTGL